MSFDENGTSWKGNASNKPVDTNPSEPSLLVTRQIDDFEQRLTAVHPNMRRLAVRMVDGEADDILQEAYVLAFRAYPRFRGEAQFETWLYRIVYNACISQLRRTRPSMGSDLELELLSSAGDTARAASNRVDLAAALETLGPTHRAAVLLVDAEGLTYEDTASILGLARGTVASRVSRARKLLRAHLRETNHD